MIEPGEVEHRLSRPKYVNGNLQLVQLRPLDWGKPRIACGRADRVLNDFLSQRDVGRFSRSHTATQFTLSLQTDEHPCGHPCVRHPNEQDVRWFDDALL